jgi:hypothetical protein
MARGDQLGRQWKIIQTLISSKMGKSAAWPKMGKSAAELAQDMECHPRNSLEQTKQLSKLAYSTTAEIQEKIF